MKLWYNTSGELREAEQEAQREVERMNAELPHYINGDVKLRMAWRKELAIGNLPVYIPEAELLVNGEVARRDLLDLLLLDLLHIQLETIAKARKTK